MKSRIIRIITVAFLVTLAQLCSASVDSNTSDDARMSNLQVYLPREITVKENCLKLGQISVIRGNESILAKASDITLGKISAPGQKIVVDRSTILSRLACNGIHTSNVTLTGAEEILVKKQQRVIKSSEFVEQAKAFLKQNPPIASVCQFDPIRVPDDLVLSKLNEDIKLTPRLVESGVGNQATVQIAVFVDNKEFAKREVTFRLKYHCHKVVTLTEIPEGSIIIPENVKIETIVSNYPEPANWKPPYGLIAKRKLPAKTVIRQNMVGAVGPAIFARRNETVVIRVERPGFVVTAVGKALQDGRVGEYIKVRNIDSKRIILCKVNEDGTVSPIM